MLFFHPQYIKQADFCFSPFDKETVSVKQKQPCKYSNDNTLLAPYISSKSVLSDRERRMLNTITEPIQVSIYGT